MTRYVYCGSSVALPTYPAWTIGGKYGAPDLPPGPGAGKYPSAADTWETGTANFGNAPAPQDRPWQNSSEIASEGRYLKPDYLSANPKAPAWSFGQRTGKGDGIGPGVGAYSPNTNTFNFPKQARAVWGPPPRSRPPSAPLRPRSESSDRRRPKPNSALPGATFKGKNLPWWPTDGPGPAYNPCCGGHCCQACEKYNGASFGIKHHVHQEPPTPAPGYYRMGCSTIGAAASGQSLEDPAKRYYHRPGRSDHAYAYSGTRHQAQYPVLTEGCGCGDSAGFCRTTAGAGTGTLSPRLRPTQRIMLQASSSAMSR